MEIYKFDTANLLYIINFSFVSYVFKNYKLNHGFIILGISLNIIGVWLRTYNNYFDILLG